MLEQGQIQAEKLLVLEWRDSRTKHQLHIMHSTWATYDTVYLRTYSCLV